jgi:hypothetical protein
MTVSLWYRVTKAIATVEKLPEQGAETHWVNGSARVLEDTFADLHDDLTSIGRGLQGCPGQLLGY